jgi:multiple sugar transport system ATP-binding protein
VPRGFHAARVAAAAQRPRKQPQGRPLVLGQLGSLDRPLDRGEGLAALHQRLDATMIYVTHDQVEAMTLADRIVVLRDGRIEQIGTPLNLYNSPANRFVAGFIGSPRMNFVEGRVHQESDGPSAIDLGGATPVHVQAPGRDGETVTLGIRPQHVALVDAESGNLALQVTLVEQLGAETVIHGTTPSGASFTIAQPGQRPLAVGDRVGLAFDRTHLHVFDQEGRTQAT